MTKYDVKNPNGALAYLVDCTLATVESMAMKKSKTKCEFKRQIAIAQIGIDWARMFNCDLSLTRADKIANDDVETWAKEIEKRWLS